MVGRLTVQERAQIAARYEVWRSNVEVQRWWRTIKGRHAQINPKTIKNCHAKLMTTGSVSDFRRSGRPSKFKDTEALMVSGGLIKGHRVSSVYSVKLRELVGDGAPGNSRSAMQPKGGVKAATRQQSRDLSDLANPLADLPEGRSSHGAVVLDQSLYVMGGRTSAGRTNSLVIFDLADNLWRDGPPMTTKRSTFGVAVFDKDIYVIGGLDAVCDVLTACEVFRTRGGRWEPINPMRNGRWGLGAAVLNGSVYAAGGWNGGSLSCLECYDPVTNTWSSMADMNNKRYGLSLCAMSDRLYAVGSDPNDGTAEVYTPATNVWQPIADVNINRSWSYLFVYRGKLFVVGGEKGNAKDLMEEYDPSRYTWEVLPMRLPSKRFCAGYALTESCRN